MGKTLAACLAALLFLFSARAAHAHAIGLSNGEYTATGTTLKAKLVFARGEVAQIAPAIDANRDGHVTAIEVRDARAVLDERVVRGVVVRAGGESCTGALTDAALTENDGLAIEASFACPSASTRAQTPAAPEMSVELALLDDLARGHRHVARITGATTRDEILYGDAKSFTVVPAPGDEPARAAPASRSTTAGFFAFFKMGVEHILTGYDHLVFLFGLVLLRARVKQLLAVVTAFTLAHSITLGLATFGVLAPSPRIVEPAIALSIAYVGVENFFVKDGSKRWRITFPFGLIHGFGFAGALREINLPRAEIPTALVSFNLGVEAGQLAVMAVVLPIVFLLRDKQSWFDPKAVRILSGGVALAGGIWFVTRVAFG
ncbi:MAG TPA: HupE/UreJ family protein [Labilithrix sp.]|jgi:hydrogenase/urease accessory protein HupE